jgi:hypothetical protein
MYFCARDDIPCNRSDHATNITSSSHAPSVRESPVFPVWRSIPQLRWLQLRIKARSNRCTNNCFEIQNSIVPLSPSRERSHSPNLHTAYSATWFSCNRPPLRPLYSYSVCSSLTTPPIPTPENDNPSLPCGSAPKWAANTTRQLRSKVRNNHKNPTLQMWRRLFQTQRCCLPVCLKIVNSI